MSLSIVLSPEIESRVRSRVGREEDIPMEINSLIRMALDAAPFDQLTDEEEKMLEKAADAGDAAFAAGRFSSGDAPFTKFQAKYGAF